MSNGLPQGNLDVAWIHGSEAAKYNTDPDIQVHEYDADTRILRQNKSVHYEAPFLYLLLGSASALLIDTGATANPQFFPLRDTVDAAIESWLVDNPHAAGYPLLVTHTHSHGDHVAGDGQFEGRPDTVVVGAKRDEAWPFFGFSEHPDSVTEIDLGDRIVDCFATPGHHEAAVTFYDRNTGLLLTGDTVYPGRLYVFDWPAFVASIDRLVDWCESHPVSHVLGCHIEMSVAAGMDYPVGWSFQPDERPLQLTPDHIRAIQTTLRDNDLRPDRYVLPELIVTPVGPAD